MEDRVKLVTASTYVNVRFTCSVPNCDVTGERAVEVGIDWMNEHLTPSSEAVADETWDTLFSEGWIEVVRPTGIAEARSDNWHICPRHNPLKSEQS
jgi:glycine cleavage system aminomethyltransferase T